MVYLTSHCSDWLKRTRDDYRNHLNKRLPNLNVGYLQTNSFESRLGYPSYCRNFKDVEKALGVGLQEYQDDFAGFVEQQPGDIICIVYVFPGTGECTFRFYEWE